MEGIIRAGIYSSDRNVRRANGTGVIERNPTSGGSLSKLSCTDPTGEQAGLDSEGKGWAESRWPSATGRNEGKRTNGIKQIMDK